MKQTEQTEQASKRKMTPREQLIADARWYRLMCDTDGHIALEAVIDPLPSTDKRRRYYIGISQDALERLITAVEKKQ